MPEKRPVVIVGNGGMARALLDWFTFGGNVDVTGFLWEEGASLSGLPVFNSIDQIPAEAGLVLGMLNPVYRQHWVKQYGADRFASVLDGNVSATAKCGQGVVSVKDTCIMSEAKVDSFVHVHTYSIIGHNCEVGEHTFVGPGVILGGRAVLGKCCRIFMGARILPGVVIGDNVAVTAGSVVTKNMPSDVMLHGNPAKPVFQTIKGMY